MRTSDGRITETHASTGMLGDTVENYGRILECQRQTTEISFVLIASRPEFVPYNAQIAVKSASLC
jgi:hypothetical protein